MLSFSFSCICVLEELTLNSLRTENERSAVKVAGNEMIHSSRTLELETDLLIELGSCELILTQLLPNVLSKTQSIKSGGYQFGRYVDGFWTHISIFTVWHQMSH